MPNGERSHFCHYPGGNNHASPIKFCKCSSYLWHQSLMHQGLDILARVKTPNPLTDSPIT